MAIARGPTNRSLEYPLTRQSSFLAECRFILHNSHVEFNYTECDPSALNVRLAAVLQPSNKSKMASSTPGEHRNCVEISYGVLDDLLHENDYPCNLQASHHFIDRRICHRQNKNYVVNQKSHLCCCRLAV